MSATGEGVGRGGLVRAAAPMTAMLIGVVAVAMMPLVRFRDFYLAGDSIAQWLPVSRRIGELIRAGDSHLMDPSLWRGGNFIGEARFGLWNPIVVVLDATVLQIDDLAVGVMVVVLAYLLVLAVGGYLLARDYGASRWPSSLAGLAVSCGGWTLWMDASWWMPHLASFAFSPFVWLAARRTARGSGSPVWLTVAGVLCVTAGNPYSAAVVVIVVVAAAVEHSGGRRCRAVLAGALVSIALVTIFVHVPFQQTSSVGFRESTLALGGTWAPGPGGVVSGLLTSSTPTATGSVPNFGREVLGFPGFYIAWFVLPLGPWLRWRELMRRERVGLVLVAVTFAVLLAGPSNLWFFRWPFRLMPYLCLPVVIGSVVAMSSGLVTDRWRSRAAASSVVVLVGAYSALFDTPDAAVWHVAGAGLVAGGTAVVVMVGVRHAAGAVAAMMCVTIAVLAVQLAWQPRNDSVRHFAMPSDMAHYDVLSARYPGTTVQIASYSSIPGAQRRPDGAYRDLSIGSASALGGVETVSAYSGIGFNTHDAALCFRFDGETCAGAWERLWQPAAGTDHRLVDLLRADTVVVQRALVDTADAVTPSGWTAAEITDTAVIWSRTSPPRWEQSRLSAVSGPVVVDSAEQVAPHREVIRIRRTGDEAAQLLFARLAWPGYEATVDGQQVPVGGGPAGLLSVSLPPEVGAGEVVLTWTPPYWRPSLAVLALGIVVALVTQVVWVRDRRDV